MSVSFAHFTPEEEALVTQIVARAETLFHEHHPHATFDRLAFEMDIAAVHAHTPLRLADWLAADNFNFVHDWRGSRCLSSVALTGPGGERPGPAHGNGSG